MFASFFDILKMKLTREAVPLLDPPMAQIIPDAAGTELVVFSGFPCLGKSTFFRRHFAPAGYTHINQDTLGSRSKCMKAAEVALKAGTSCVVGKYLLFLYELAKHMTVRQTIPIETFQLENIIWISRRNFRFLFGEYFCLLTSTGT